MLIKRGQISFVPFFFVLFSAILTLRLPLTVSTQKKMQGGKL